MNVCYEIFKHITWFIITISSLLSIKFVDFLIVNNKLLKLLILLFIIFVKFKFWIFKLSLSNLSSSILCTYTNKIKKEIGAKSLQYIVYCTIKKPLNFFYLDQTQGYLQSMSPTMYIRQHVCNECPLNWVTLSDVYNCSHSILEIYLHIIWLHIYNTL